MVIPCLCLSRFSSCTAHHEKSPQTKGLAASFLVDIPTEAVDEVRGPDELRLLIFPQPLGRALKNQNAAPASPPCFRRRRRSAPQLFESTLAAPFSRQVKQKLRYPLDTGVLGGAKQPKSEPLPSGASLAAISSKVMVFVPSL